MKKALEIEFKNTLTRREYRRVKSYFQLKKKVIHTHCDYYFDTDDYELSRQGSYLRVRYNDKNSRAYEMILKEKRDDDTYQESILSLSKAEFLRFRLTQKLEGNKLLERVVEKITSPLKYKGKIKNRRAEFFYRGGYYRA